MIWCEVYQRGQVNAFNNPHPSLDQRQPRCKEAISITGEQRIILNNYEYSSQNMRQSASLLQHFQHFKTTLHAWYTNGDGGNATSGRICTQQSTSNTSSKLSLIMRFACCYLLELYPVGYSRQTGTRTLSKGNTGTRCRIQICLGTRTPVVQVPGYVPLYATRQHSVQRTSLTCLRAWKRHDQWRTAMRTTMSHRHEYQQTPTHGIAIALQPTALSYA